MSNRERKEGVKSKRQMMREQHQRRARQQRTFFIGGTAVVGLVIILAIAIPTIKEATTPVGDFVRITPVAMATADGFKLGDPNAKVKLEVFEDYQCSACKSYTTNIEPLVISELVDKGLVYYIMYQFPFLDDDSAIKDSDQAASAALCASEQNRFWDFSHMLFVNSNQVVGGFSDKRLAAFAEALGLDMDQFQACYDADKYQDMINEHLALGKSMNVSGTPSVFVNGLNIKPGYVPSFEEIKAAVEAALAGY